MPSWEPNVGLNSRIHDLSRKQVPLDVLIFIAMTAPVEYRAGPPVKPQQSRYIHSRKIGDMRPWGSPVLLLYSHGLISSAWQFGLSEQKTTLTTGLCISVLFPGLGSPHNLGMSGGL